MWVTLNLWEALFGRPVWTLLNASPTSHTSVIACSHLPTNVADKNLSATCQSKHAVVVCLERAMRMDVANLSNACSDWSKRQKMSAYNSPRCCWQMLLTFSLCQRQISPTFVGKCEHAYHCSVPEPRQKVWHVIRPNLEVWSGDSTRPITESSETQIYRCRAYPQPCFWINLSVTNTT